MKARSPPQVGKRDDSGQGRSVTLADIARHAAVSRSTVSLVLNGSSSIPETTSKRVIEAAAALGYVYNRRAAGLRSQRSGLIAIAINDLESPYFAEVVAGAQAEIERRGHVAILSNSSEDPSRQAEFLSRIREYSVDGVLICPASGAGAQMIRDVQAWAPAVVVFSRHVMGVDGDFVGGDNYSGMRQLMAHLLAKGHRTFAHIGVNPAISPSRDRLTAFRDALAGAGIAGPAAIVELNCAATREEGFRAATRLLGEYPTVTAITCYNDIIAFGAMLALQSKNIVPGQAISVTGFDNVSESALWRPGLTTVNVSRAEVGRMAASRLFERLAKTASEPAQEFVAAELVVRGSS